MNEKPTNPCSPVTDNPAEDAFYRKVEDSIHQSDDGNTYISGPDSVTPKREPNKHAVEAAITNYGNAMFNCGEFDEQATLAAYDELLAKVKQARDVLVSQIDLARAEGTKTITELTEYKDKLHEVVADLRREIAELQRDKARLDWLDSRKTYHAAHWGTGTSGDPGAWQNPSVSWQVMQSRECGTYEQPKELDEMTVRQAIDAAIAVDNAPQSSTTP